MRISLVSPSFNFLVGANGSGKTSVLEAIYTLGHGRAFRSLQIGRVIRHEQDSFVLHGRLQGEERETAIGLTKDKQGDGKVRYRRHRRPQGGGTGAPDADAADHAGGVYFTQRRPQIQKSVP